MNATAQSLENARTKAENLANQGFFVEIRDDEGHLVPANVEH